MKRKNLILISWLVLFAIAFSKPVLADDGGLASMVESMQKAMKDMTKTIEAQNQKIQVQDHKIQDLENRPAGSVSMAVPQGGESKIPPTMSDADFKDKLDTTMGNVGTSKWLKDLKFSGDLRLRYEPATFHSGNPAASGDMNRFRFRLRYGFEKKFTPDMKVGFRLASGSTTDGTSTNQTLTGNFVDKVHTIDRAYAIYTPAWAAKKGVLDKSEFGGGKFTNPFTRGSTDMVWDDDVNPEGAYEMFDFTLLDHEDMGLKAYALLGQMILTQNAHAAGVNNAELYAYQFGIMPEVKVGDMPLKFTDAVSFYDYNDYGKHTNFTVAGGNPTAIGDATTLAGAPFKVFDIYNSVEFKPLASLPVVKLYIDFARNVGAEGSLQAADGEQDAWALGTKLGKAADKGTWELGYAYKYIEANSVVGAFNDSDFGHSGRRGSVFSGKYAITDSVQAGLTGFVLNNLNSDALARDQQELRFLCDLVWSF